MRARANSKGSVYKRSWKNLLLNKRYQLRFTLFMVGLSVALMCGLVFGTNCFWKLWPSSWSSWGGVVEEADEATRVGINAAIERCPEVPKLVAEGDDEASDQVDKKTTPMAVAGQPPKLPDAGSAAGAGSGSGSGDEEEHHATVQMEEETMTFPVPPDFGDSVVAHWTCLARYWGQEDNLFLGRTRILWVLAASGVLLVFGLAIYGLKMTHRVAGPLFKVSLYFAKMRDGRFDKVYNLRKGDQLVDFYEHFKEAHAGVVTREREDIAELRAVVAAAEGAGLGDHDATKQLRELIARKEKSLE